MAREPKQTHKHYRKEENVDFVTLERYFPVVEVESLTMGDRFLREHVPRSRNEERIWRSCECAVRYRTRNFRRNSISPSLNEEGKIEFREGLKPAVGKPARWWAENAKQVCLEKKSRLATVFDEDLFNGILIRYLIEQAGFTVSEAWKSVCKESAMLGNFWDSPGSPHALEPTGSRKIGRFHDFGNTCKIVCSQLFEEKYCYYGGDFWDLSHECPLGSLIGIPNEEVEKSTSDRSSAVIVMEV